MGPTHNGERRVSQRGGRGGWYRLFAASRVRHYMWLLFIMWRLSLLCQDAGGASFLRTCRIDEPRDASWAFHTRANRLELQIVRPSAARDGGWDRGMRDVSVEIPWRREERPKTDGSFAYARPNASPFRCCFTLDEFVLSRVPSPSPSPSCVTRVVALAVAYRYGYGIRHTSQSTNGYFAETTSRRFLQEMPPPPGWGAITNDEGGKSRSNFPLTEPKEAFGSANSGGSDEWWTTYMTYKNIQHVHLKTTNLINCRHVF